MNKKIRDYNIEIGNLPTGQRNSITDVQGVKVGHVSLNEGSMKTGVTAIIPHGGNIFKEKVMAATHVINGFGKTIGTVQIDELGTLETPIILTNTLSVGVCAQALVDYMLKDNPEIGRTTGTINPVVGECNDMYLNDIRAQFVKPEHVYEALEAAGIKFEQGAVGAGTGMTCFGLKGGIGSSSRIIEYQHGTYTLGVLVLSNFGKSEDFILNGVRKGSEISQYVKDNTEDKGSIIFIVATDLPVSERQLKRIIKRTSVGLARTGSYYGNGSGDLVIGFTTAHKIPHDKEGLIQLTTIHDEDINLAFQAVSEATEEAILNSMIAAEDSVGRDGNTRLSLHGLLKGEIY